MRKLIQWVSAGVLMAALLLGSVVQAQAKNSCLELPFDQKAWWFSHALELKPGYWTEGSHTYEMHVNYVDPAGVPHSLQYTTSFTVSNSAPLIAGQVHLRAGILLGSESAVTEINPDQDTVALFTWVLFQSLGRDVAKTFRQNSELLVSIDGGDWIDAPAGPLTSTCTGGSSNPGNFHREWGAAY